MLGLCDQYMTPTLDAALLISSRAGTDPGVLFLRGAEAGFEPGT